MRKKRNRFIAACTSVALVVGLLPLSSVSAFAQAPDTAAELFAAEADANQASAYSAEELSISIDGAIHDGDTDITLTIAGDTKGRYVMVRVFDASDTVFRPSYIPYEDDTVIFNKANVSAGQSTVTLKTPVKEGQQVVAFIYDYDEDINVRKLAASAPVSVAAAGSTTPAQPEEIKRSDLLNGSYITLTTPHESGVAAGKFLTTDRSATAEITLHQAVPSATLSVVAWPRTLSFGSDFVDSGEITRFGKRLFTKYGVKNGDVVDIAFDDAVFSSLEDPTSYVIIAYLQFADTTSEDSWPIVKPTARFDIVNDTGESFADYEFPDATIDESELPVGATSLHFSLTGDERLFQLARDTRGSSDNFQIHVSVVAYDASVTPETFDYEETEQTRLFTMDAYEPFTAKEITFDQPLEEGQRVRALVYTTQYSGSLTSNPIPASHDYDATKPDDSVLVTTTAPPVASNPAVEIASSLTAEMTSFDAKVANPPEGSLLLVKAYAPEEDIATQNGTFLASVSAAAGTCSITTNTPLVSGWRVVVFLMSSGKVLTQSAPATVSDKTTAESIVILGPVDKSDSTVKVQVNCDIPEGAHISVRQFDTPVNTKWGSQNSVGSVQNPVRGENVVSVSGIRRSYIVAFLATDYGNTIYAASEPVEVTHEATAPRATIAPADVMFTEGDMFLTLTWSADKYAKKVTYSIYQYSGDTFDAATAEVIASGDLVNSISNSGIQDISLSGALRAQSKVCAVIQADDLSATSNALTVGEKPDWATDTPRVEFGQSAVRVSDPSVLVRSLYGEGYEQLGSEYFCVVSVYEISAELVEQGFTDEDLEGIPVAARFYNDTRSDQTRGDLTMTFNENVQLTEGNYLVIKLRLPDPLRQDKQAMWRDYVSEAIPVVASDAILPGEGGTGQEKPGEGGTGQDKPGEGGTGQDKPDESGAGQEKPGEGTGQEKPGEGDSPTGSDGETEGTESSDNPSGQTGDDDASDDDKNSMGDSDQQESLLPSTGDVSGMAPAAFGAMLAAAASIVALNRLRFGKRVIRGGSRR